MPPPAQFLDVLNCLVKGWRKTDLFFFCFSAWIYGYCLYRTPFIREREREKVTDWNYECKIGTTWHIICRVLTDAWVSLSPGKRGWLTQRLPVIQRARKILASCHSNYFKLASNLSTHTHPHRHGVNNYKSHMNVCVFTMRVCICYSRVYDTFIWRSLKAFN